MPAPKKPAVAAAPKLKPTVGSTAFGFLGFLDAGAEGCTVRFGIEQQTYFLATTLPNYNSLFSLLLACWLNRHKVSLTHGLGGLTPVLPGSTTPTLKIVSVDAFFTAPSTP